jgi:hypothetical protein
MSNAYRGFDLGEDQCSLFVTRLASAQLNPKNELKIGCGAEKPASSTGVAQRVCDHFEAPNRITLR